MGDRGIFILVGNVTGDRVLREGTKVALLRGHDEPDKVEITGLSKGGRTITKFVHLRRLSNIHPKWTATEDAPDVVPGFYWTARQDAIQRAITLNGRALELREL